MTDTRINPKVNLIQALINLILVLLESNRPEEQAFARGFASVLNSEQGQAAIEELKKRDYVDANGKSTPFGRKLALVGTSPTPNFRREAEKSPNVAFAMLFAAFVALRETHIKGNQIYPRDPGDTTLVDELEALRIWIFDHTTQHFGTDDEVVLEQVVAEEEKPKKPAKKAVKKAEETPA